MIPSPIRKALSSIQTNQLQCLIMGGQACVLYGAAEFSRDLDLALLLEPENLARFEKVLISLDAECIALPPFDLRYLSCGHAVYFRCRAPEVNGLRIDIMSKLRGVDEFAALWARRTTIKDQDGSEFQLLSLPDLVRAKKTQRDKDWPMIRRLMEAHYFANRGHATPEQTQFWLEELRTPELLLECARTAITTARELVVRRPLLQYALSGERATLESALLVEEQKERGEDRVHWAPLKNELAELRRQRRSIEGM